MNDVSSAAMEDSPKSLIRSAARFFSGTLFSRITGMGRDVAMAFAFGTEAELAAFLVAFRLAHLLRRVMGEGALQTAFIPHFEKLRQENPLEAGRFFLSLYASLSLLLIAVIVLGMTICGGCLWLNLFDPGTENILLFTLLMLPSLLFICLFGLNASLLQCEKSYFIPAIAPAAFNIIWMAGIFIVSHFPIKEAMEGLSLIIIFACLVQWAATMPKTLAALRSQGVKGHFTRAGLFSKHVRSLGKPLFLGIAGVAAAQINNALDSIFARYADSEGPAYLWYAIRIQQLPLALLGIAISGALLPPLARAFKTAEWTKFHSLLQFCLRQTCFLMIPAAVAMTLMAGPGAALIYGHGDFNGLSLTGTVHCLWAYAFGLLPMALILILAPAFYAAGNYRIPSLASLTAVIVNISFNAWLVLGLGMGAPSVALATSLSAWLNLGLLWGYLRSTEHLGRAKSVDIASTVWQVLLATGTASLAAFFCELTLFESSNTWKILIGAAATAPIPGFFTNAIHLAVEGTVFCSAYLASAKLFGSKDLATLNLRLFKIRVHYTERE